jgi:molybdopterin converting factor small subunit
MQQIDEQERRLAAALARIGAAAERLAEPPPAGAAATAGEPDSAAEVEAAMLRRKLAEAEARLAEVSAEVAARDATLRERQAATVATLEARVAALTQQIDAQGIESQRLRMVNVQLREALRGLREALTDGMADAGQINRALQAEVDAMHAARQSEAAELEALLAALGPKVQAAEDAMTATEADDARA